MKLWKCVTIDSRVHITMDEKELADRIIEQQDLMKVLGFSYPEQKDEQFFHFSTLVEKVAEQNKITKMIVLGLASSD